MAVLHRALLSWFLGLVFLILLVLRLSERTQWNWFIVFIPMWIFDGAVMTYAGFYVFSRCRGESRQLCTSFDFRKLYFVVPVTFKLSLQILICLKLEVPSWDIPLYYVFIPLWCILLIVILTMMHHLIQIAADHQIFMESVKKMLSSRSTANERND